MVLSMEAPRLSLLPLPLVVVVALRREGGRGRRGQMRKLKVVCERRKTRESSRRRAGSERESRSRCSGFRASGGIVVGLGDAGGATTMELAACCALVAGAMCTYATSALCT